MTATTSAPAASPSVPAARPPAPPGPPATALVFAHRAVLKLRHGPEQMADAIVIPVLFTLLFTYLFGGALTGSTGNYLQDLLPGTLVMAILLVTVYSGLVLKTDLDRGVLDRFRSMPLRRGAQILGSLLGDAGRYVLATTIVVGLGLLMGFRPDGGPVGVLLAVGLVLWFAFSLSWVWTTLALVVRTPTALSLLSFLVQFPLVFASNVFVDPDTMPGWLRSFVTLNPVSSLVTTVRGLMHGTVDLGQAASVLLASAAILAVFAPLTLRLYRTAT